MADDLGKLAADLTEAGREVQRRGSQIVRKTGEDTVGDAQTIVHVITGNLKNSIGADYDPDGLGFTAGPTASYGGYEEFGTAYRPPHPYMIPAYERRYPQAVQAAEQLGVEVVS